MTTQLWGWKYNGLDEFGSQSSDNSCIFKITGTANLRHKDRITDLHKVKVVDEDAVVLEGIDELERRIDRAIESIKPSWMGVFIDIQKKVKEQSKPPVTEPTGFAAVVEADMSSDQNRQMFVKNLFWFRKDDPERGFLWNSLQNPVVLSEGVSNGLR